MKRLRLLAMIPLTLLMVACGSTVADPQPRDPLEVKPAAAEVLAMSGDFQFEFLPGATIADVEWDVEIEYATREVQAVFDFYDAELLGQGFTRTSIDLDDDEVEAEYSKAGLEIDLEVERDGGRVDVDLEIDDFTGPYPAGFSLTTFAGVDLPIYAGADVVDVEWDFNFDHPANDVEEVFAYYDGHLQDLGWTQTEIDDGDDDEMEAEYVKDGVHLEVEVEDDGEVELEFNKLRFY